MQRSRRPPFNWSSKSDASLMVFGKRTISLNSLA